MPQDRQYNAAGLLALKSSIVANWDFRSTTNKNIHPARMADMRKVLGSKRVWGSAVVYGGTQR